VTEAEARDIVVGKLKLLGLASCYEEPYLEIVAPPGMQFVANGCFNLTLRVTPNPWQDFLLRWERGFEPSRLAPPNEEFG
jgi:hypothetical protein